MPVWMVVLRGPPLAHFDAPPLAGFVGFSMVIVLIWWLLHTTPTHAITLPVSRSKWIILLGAVWLHANAVAWHGWTLSASVEDPSTGGRFVFSAAMIVMTWLLIRATRRANRSPWWAVLIGWHPLAIVALHGTGIAMLTTAQPYVVTLSAVMLWGWMLAKPPAVKHPRP